MEILLIIPAFLIYRAIKRSVEFENRGHVIYTTITDHVPTQTDGWEFTSCEDSASGRDEWSRKV